jgi:hypothetical protein
MSPLPWRDRIRSVRGAISGDRATALPLVQAFHAPESNSFDFECLALQAGNWGLLAFVDGHVKYTESIGTNANETAHDWRATHYNEKTDELGKNTYDIR